ncbi:hypothetical protein KR054_000605 [Drosophila jambulina]|nr:hypothetical protein KR054_000605 [Drosophila jambulina]
MELLIYKLANNRDYRIDCNARNLNLPVELKEDYKNSRLFATLSHDASVAMATDNVTHHSHRFCYTEEDFQKNPATQIWRVLASNHDWHGRAFVSIVEHTIYPFYGVQFHPEKPQYEFTKQSIPHTSAAIATSQYFVDYFVSECRRSNQSFANATEQAMSLIYNYKPEYTSILNSVYTQQYLFSRKEMGHVIKKTKKPN